MLDGRESVGYVSEKWNSSPISGIQKIVSGLKDNVINVLLYGDKWKKKKEILAQIGVSGKLLKDQQAELVTMFESDYISEEEIQSSIVSFLKFKTLNLYQFLWKPDVFRRRWKTVRLKRFVNDLDKEDKIILWYGVNAWVLTPEQIELLPFDDHYGIEDFKNEFWSEEAVQIYYDKLMQSCIN